MTITFQLLDRFNRPISDKPVAPAYPCAKRAKLEAQIAHAHRVFTSGQDARVKFLTI